MCCTCCQNNKLIQTHRDHWIIQQQSQPTHTHTSKNHQTSTTQYGIAGRRHPTTHITHTHTHSLQGKNPPSHQKGVKKHLVVSTACDYRQKRVGTKRQRWIIENLVRFHGLGLKTAEAISTEWPSQTPKYLQWIMF